MPNPLAAVKVPLCWVFKGYTAMDSFYLSFFTVCSGIEMSQGRKAYKQKYLGTTVPLKSVGE